jgi:BirA family biotin operon repressor/biotin-[acetyl-CoA-carboxylase] ligase
MNAQRIMALSRAGALGQVSVEVVAETGSTNADLLARAPGLASPVLLVAEHQTAGRGRAGRSWLSAPVAVGTALAETLGRLGQPVQLKWPNDVLKDGDKLAGILVETAAASDGAAWAVIGIGLNLAMPDELEQQIGRPVAAVPWLARMDRDTLLAAVLDGLLDALRLFDKSGFSAFAARWNLLHGWQGQLVTIIDRGEILHEGLAAGVDDAGRLLLDTESGRVAIVAGDVSLRIKA